MTSVKVVQAAGRVIRTTSDRGVVYLMDDRFTRPDIQNLLPAWWKVVHLRARRSKRSSLAQNTPDNSRTKTMPS